MLVLVPHMGPITDGTIKPLPTRTTLVWKLLRVHAHNMVLQVARLGKSLATVTAVEGSLLGMHPEVGMQVLLRGKCPAAVLTGKGLLVGVSSLMVLQVALLREGHAAGCAFKPPLLAMDCPNVLNHVSLMRECPAAHAADEGLVSTVGPLVSPDVGRGSADVGAEAALVAPVFSLVGMLVLEVVLEEGPRGEGVVAVPTFQGR